jgi:hypothetical protein
MANERFEVQRTIAAEPSAIFKLLTDPQGHVAIDSSGMLQSAEGVPVGGVGDTFVVHMDREALNDYASLARHTGQPHRRVRRQHPVRSERTAGQQNRETPG